MNCIWNFGIIKKFIQIILTKLNSKEMIITGYDNKYFVEYDFDFINVKNELKLLAVVFELKKVAGNHLLYLNIIPLLIRNKFITM